jgi:hypothetical protein
VLTSIPAMFPSSSLRFFLFVCFLFFFILFYFILFYFIETGFICIALAILELTL